MELGKICCSIFKYTIYFEPLVKAKLSFHSLSLAAVLLLLARPCKQSRKDRILLTLCALRCKQQLGDTEEQEVWWGFPILPT